MQFRPEQELFEGEVLVDHVREVVRGVVGHRRRHRRRRHRRGVQGLRRIRGHQESKSYFIFVEIIDFSK